MAPLSDSVDVFKPAWYQDDPVTPLDLNVVSIFWGMALMLAVFTFGKAARHTVRSWQRHRRITAYVGMIWGAWILNVIPSVVTWFHFYGEIPSGFFLLLFVVLFWSVQIQLLMQIIINRVSLLMDDPVKVKRLKWSVFFIILVLTVSVIVIWIPASLQISRTWHTLNAVWDRAKQAVLMIMDVCLNGYFLYCVRNRLIANGLDKYRSLFRLNIFMVFIVVALDATFIGLMSLDLSTAYLQFQPVAYLSKLYIEMSMADLIRKIVKSTNELNHIAYLSTINGVPVSASAPFVSSPTPTPDLQGPPGLVHQPNHVEARRQASFLKGDVELGEFSRVYARRVEIGMNRRAASSMSPVDGFYATPTKSTATATVTETQQQQQQHRDLSRESSALGLARNGSAASSTLPLRPRSRLEQQDSSRDDLSGTYTPVI